jgi:preprotein translocase subunit SecG
VARRLPLGRPIGGSSEEVFPVTACSNSSNMKLNKLTIVLAALALVSLAFAQRIHI